MDLSIIGYDPAAAWMKTVDSVDEARAALDPAGGGVRWIHVDGIRDRDEDRAAVAALAEAFGIHPLTVEDIQDENQRPKAEEFDGYLFVTFKALSRQSAAFEQISLVLMDRMVITFRRAPGAAGDGGEKTAPGGAFERLRRRILNNAGRVRRMSADYLVYGIMDAVVDDYFLVLDDLGAALEDFEDRSLDERDTGFMQDLQGLKKELLRVRRVVWPLRESLALILHTESGLVRDETAPFFKDVHDAVVQAAETVETCREHLAGVMEMRFSVMSHRMNSVMKVLTIISTIFIPLTFIVGVYGMNFVNMPELTAPYGYPVVWGVMIGVVIGMVVFFKRRRWL